MALRSAPRVAQQLFGSVFARSFASESAVVKVPAFKDIPTTIKGCVPAGDLRATSGLGLGDGILNHTDKWMQGGKSPMEYIMEVEPIKVKGLVVASHGSDDPALGCPVEFISLKGTSKENPAVCKYTGNRYYSDDWKYGAHHH